MFPFVSLTEGSVCLRPFQHGDEQMLHQAVHESLTDLEPWMPWVSNEYSIENVQYFITSTRAHWADGTLYAFAITDTQTGMITGGCSLSHIHPEYRFCNLGYWVRSSRHGEGISSRAAKLAAKFAFEKINIIRAEIVIAVENKNSIQAAHKMGAHDEGILLNRLIVGNRIYNAHMFSLLPSDFGLIADIPKNHV